MSSEHRIYTIHKTNIWQWKKRLIAHSIEHHHHIVQIHTIRFTHFSRCEPYNTRTIKPQINCVCVLECVPVHVGNFRAAAAAFLYQRMTNQWHRNRQNRKRRHKIYLISGWITMRTATVQLISIKRNGIDTTRLIRKLYICYCCHWHWSSCILHRNNINNNRVSCVD